MISYGLHLSVTDPFDPGELGDVDSLIISSAQVTQFGCQPIFFVAEKVVELPSHSLSRLQQYLAMFDQAAIQAVVIGQPDLLSRIKNFFRLNERNGLT